MKFNTMKTSRRGGKLIEQEKSRGQKGYKSKTGHILQVRFTLENSDLFDSYYIYDNK